jgi:hypothetical protein
MKDIITWSKANTEPSICAGLKFEDHIAIGIDYRKGSLVRLICASRVSQPDRSGTTGANHSLPGDPVL